MIERNNPSGRTIVRRVVGMIYLLVTWAKKIHLPAEVVVKTWESDLTHSFLSVAWARTLDFQAEMWGDT